MFYGAPVTAPMEIPPEVYSSPNAPELPGLPEMPELIDAKTKGLRLQGTLAKALPPMTNAGSMTNVRQMEAEEYARDIGIAFDISRQQERRSKAIAKAKGRQMQRAAEPKVKSGGKRAAAGSRRNARYAKGRSYNAAYAYGYDPNRAMG